MPFLHRSFLPPFVFPIDIFRNSRLCCFCREGSIPCPSGPADRSPHQLPPDPVPRRTCGPALHRRGQRRNTVQLRQCVARPPVQVASRKSRRGQAANSAWAREPNPVLIGYFTTTWCGMPALALHIVSHFSFARKLWILPKYRVSEKNEDEANRKRTIFPFTPLTEEAVTSDIHADSADSCLYFWLTGSSFCLLFCRLASLLPPQCSLAFWPKALRQGTAR